MPDSLHIKHGLICRGHGWGSPPWHMAADDLANGQLNGQLVELSPDRWDGADHMPSIPYVLAREKAAPSGPAGEWLFENLSGQAWQLMTR